MKHWLNTSKQKTEVAIARSCTCKLQQEGLQLLLMIRLVKLHLWDHNPPEGIFILLLINTTPFS